MTRVRLRCLPGLRRSWLDWETMFPSEIILRRFHSSFPPHPATLMATLASGQPASAHGIFGEVALDGSRIETPKADYELARDDRWLQTDTPSQIAVEEWVRQCRAEFDADPDALWIFVGAPTARLARHVIDPLSALPNDTPHRVEGRLLRVARELTVDERDRLLQLDGVERVLCNEARERRGLDHPEAGASVVLSESGVGFRAGDVLFESDDECWIAVVGADAEQRCGTWPSAVHDLRVAPTVALWQGRDVGEFADKPLRSARA